MKWVSLLFAIAVACTPPEPPHPGPPDASSCGVACSNLAELCEEIAEYGAVACTKACQRAEGNGISFNIHCLSSAHNAQEVTDCGSSRCTPR